jgi:hypothetical protein
MPLFPESTPLPADPGTGQPPEPEKYGWGLSPSRFLGRILRTFEAVVTGIQQGKAPVGSHILYLALVLVALVALVASLLFAILHEPAYLFASLAVATVGILVLVLFPSRLLPRPVEAATATVNPPPVPDAATLDHDSKLKAALRWRDHLLEVAKRCNQIYERLKGPSHPFPDVLAERLSIRITPQGGLIATDTTTIRTSRPTQVLLHELTGSSELESFWDLKFTVSAVLVSGVPQTVVALPALETSNTKKVLLFFPPEIPAGTQIEYTMRWEWPGLWADLFAKGKDYWAVTAKTASPIPLIRIEFRLPPDFPVVLSDRGAGGQAVVTDPPKDEDGCWLYAWEAYNVAHDQQVIVDLSR